MKNVKGNFAVNALPNNRRHFNYLRSGAKDNGNHNQTDINSAVIFVYFFVELWNNTF
jgi:hypothetical protein